MAGDDDEDLELDLDASTGSEGDGAEGQDTAGGNAEGDLPAEHADAQADDGQPDDQVGDGKPSRGESRVQRLANERTQERERAERLQRDLDEERRRNWQRSQQLTEEQERERLALMTPEERSEYRIDKMQRQMNEERRLDRMQTGAMMDKAAYDAKATISPVYKRHQAEVERRFQDQMQKGAPVERELILKVLLGEKVLEGANGTGRQNAAAKRRVAAQRVEPTSGKGDTASQRGKAGDSAEKRLQGVFI